MQSGMVMQERVGQLLQPLEIKVPEPPASGISAVNPGMPKIPTGLNPGRGEIRPGDTRKKIH
jgi:hypothetical protein